jgi:nanoRNase/pAp phosphatase (c-di-AMP/oligoRNAs hydrolase)
VYDNDYGGKMNKTKQKKELKTIAEKKRIAEAIIDEIIRLNSFVMIGHKNPDTDCIAALASFALLLRKMGKEATLCFAGPVEEQFNYLLAICKYNGASIIYGENPLPADIDALVVLDTPKPEMLAAPKALMAMLDNPKIRKIEVDHHLEGDAVYIGDSGFSLVSEASSTCEHLGYIAYKMSHRPGLEKIDFYTRNLVLALLTGIVGDSHMGRYLKSDKEKMYYRLFSETFDKMLIEKTHKGSGNLASMSAVFDAINHFSVREKKCYSAFMTRRHGEPPIYYACLDQDESKAFFSEYGSDMLVEVARAVTDALANDSGKIGISAYYDESDRIQGRIRRNAAAAADRSTPGLDLRQVLQDLRLTNGGGHPGAVAFHVPASEVPHINAFCKELSEKIMNML